MKIELTNMILIENEGKFLFLNRRRSTWPGITFPGGHIEENESLEEAVIREAYEETGLVISNVKLVNVIEWLSKDKREIAFLYYTNQFKGMINSSFEGEVFFKSLEEIDKNSYSNDFDKILRAYNLG